MFRVNSVIRRFNIRYSSIAVGQLDILTRDLIKNYKTLISENDKLKEENVLLNKKFVEMDSTITEIDNVINDLIKSVKEQLSVNSNELPSFIPIIENNKVDKLNVSIDKQIVSNMKLSVIEKDLIKDKIIETETETPKINNPVIANLIASNMNPTIINNKRKSKNNKRQNSHIITNGISELSLNNSMYLIYFIFSCSFLNIIVQ